MKNLELNLGKICNNRCAFCATGLRSRQDKGWPRLEAVRDALRKGREEGAEAVGFIGGEPTLYPALAEAVAVAREAGYQRIAICTNGRLLADPDRLETLLDAGLNRVALSIHSHRASLEDRITRRPGAFAQKLDALSHLVRAARDGRLAHGLSLNTVIHRQNVGQLEPLVSFFAARGVSDIRLNFIRPEPDADDNRAWVPRLQVLADRLLGVVARNEAELGLHLTLSDVPLCQLPWELLSNPALRTRYLGAARDLETEVTMYRPEEKGAPRRFNWQAQRTGYLKTHPPVCAGCALRGACEGIWRAYLDLFGAAELADGPALARAVGA